MTDRFRRTAVGATVMAAVLVTASTVLPTQFGVPKAHAACSDVEVVFARGTDQPQGLGREGQAFVNALKPQLGGRSLGVYAVVYPATYDFLAAADGANDASAHIQGTMADCPATRIVLAGYSQGAAIVDVLAAVPFPAIGFNAPLPPDAPDHIAALAVFGNPSTRLGLPLTASPVYGSRSIDLCIAGDPICSDGNDVAAHSNYVSAGLVQQGANFVAGLL
ncbi:cutinase family protein [Mycolicibacterium komossense]|uniref:Cutinase family protein n=1 Tax=Mycolicibacterium komossense TaxID=1779 RepID=A0ABT3CD47_9MYCO|nr:cutinase family protein [Mycolicibacterium komossense]